MFGGETTFPASTLVILKGSYGISELLMSMFGRFRPVLETADTWLTHAVVNT